MNKTYYGVVPRTKVLCNPEAIFSCPDEAANYVASKGQTYAETAQVWVAKLPLASLLEGVTAPRELVKLPLWWNIPCSKQTG